MSGLGYDVASVGFLTGLLHGKGSYTAPLLQVCKAVGASGARDLTGFVSACSRHRKYMV